MNDDLISRHVVIEAIDEMSFTMSKCLTREECYGMNRAKQFILEQIKQLPSTAEEPRKGRWIDANCSECGWYVYSGDADNYCPHCGAKMEEVTA